MEPGRGSVAGFAGAGAVCLLVLALGCGQSTQFGPSGTAEADFLRAQSEYESGHYVNAVELLDAFERRHPGSQYIDDALLLLGKAHQSNDEHVLARQAFERLREDYPQSPYAEEALFQVAQSWYRSIRGPALDPEPTEEALRSFRVYLRRYPEGAFHEAALAGERGALGVLAEKAYLNGETYLKLRRYDAARRCFERSLEQWAESPRSAEALAGIARSYERAGTLAEARSSYQRLLDHLGTDPARYRNGEALAREAGRKLAELTGSGS
jgi:outer membrane protein assembly factor BamD